MEHLQPDLTEIKYALEKCLNTRTVLDVRNLLNDEGLNPILKELIEGVEIKFSDPTARKRVLTNMTLKQLDDSFNEK